MFEESQLSSLQSPAQECTLDESRNWRRQYDQDLGLARQELVAGRNNQELLSQQLRVANAEKLRSQARLQDVENELKRCEEGKTKLLQG